MEEYVDGGDAEFPEGLPMAVLHLRPKPLPPTGARVPQLLLGVRQRPPHLEVHDLEDEVLLGSLLTLHLDVLHVSPEKK